MATNGAITQPCKHKVITQPSSKNIVDATFAAKKFLFADWYLRYQISVKKSSYYEFYGNVRG
jgi:hypothetical protein